ncbi:MAG: GNAT family N-acetyltransferase [Burkholderiaceae bacterium]|nr:GNAT family N-acetyltransferase [Burkholderiaceae bacterium]
MGPDSRRGVDADGDDATATRPARLVAVQSAAQRAAAEALIREYLRWIAAIAHAHYGLAFDTDAMVRSDLDDHGKFYPPSGRFYLVEQAGAYIGVGCLKQLGEGLGEVQRMYVQPQVRGVGAGRLLIQRLLADAREIGYHTVRLESLRALRVAHRLYRSVGFVEIEPYRANSMDAYQSDSARDRYRRSAVFMEACFGEDAGAIVRAPRSG